MSQLDPRVPKLEALLTRIKTRAAEPRAAQPVQAAPVKVAAAAPAPQPIPIAAKGPATAPPPTAPPPTAPPPTAPPAESVVRSAPHTIGGPPPSRRSHGALPAVSPPPARPSSPANTAIRIPEDRKTPVPTSTEPASFGSDATLSAVRIDADSSVDALLAQQGEGEADYDDATIQASVEKPSTTLAGVGVGTLPPLTRSPVTPIPQAPASAPRAIEAPYEEEERHHTPPPESGKQKAPSLVPAVAAPVAVPAARKSGELPRLNDDDPADDEGTLSGVGGGLGAPAAKVTGSVVAEARPIVQTVHAASLPKGTVAAATSGSAAPTAPSSLGDLLDLTLAL